MVNLNEIKQDVKIEYPCNWQYTVILDKGVDFSEFIKEFNLEKFSVTNSKESKNYKSYILTTKVQNEAQRLELFSLLGKKAKFVL
ncbi:HP0495 family protein [Campylobacter canadensis]|uniref:DUF493 domain-containing protein n=1 Tax=Campylobacter canadensis TaxID=449520 RepID=A0ABS7WRR4_9BACT|nr:DUF493 family protein [Campylobacter canadensis]MBZ7987451.1 DUF493 domain-containing protein [Campylobacter canadensis]MBZ7995367.1 DUF493 domain-containing protein [Campylobacter canadensis]MBZ7996751.1 DUF493 domain-containing protein [Campylobacter canadensis]MBZ7998646.1 DUF493 domain-containing protein [Campylobacter canadensis]MBZ8000729.1 DUF493 domain-containing protein [Campylobacter canadensis]